MKIPTFVVLKKKSVVFVRLSSLDSVPFRNHRAPMALSALQEYVALVFKAYTLTEDNITAKEYNR